MPIDPQQTYVHLADDGLARSVPGDTFWQLPPAELAAFDKGWMISEFSFTEDWPNWEMHPHGDEFVYLLAGSVELLLERAGGVETIMLEGSGAVLVPRGVWHTARVRLPSRMLHVTRGEGTAHRPI